MRRSIVGPCRALLCVALLGGSLVGMHPAVAEDLDTLRDRAQSIADEVSRLEHRRESLELKGVALESDIENANKSIADLELRIQDTELAQAAAMQRYVDRAIETYKSGGQSTRLALLLSARDLDQLFMMAQATSHAAAMDTDSLQDLLATKEDAEQIQERIDGRKQRLLVAKRRADAVGEEVRLTLDTRHETLAKLNAEIKALEAELRRRARVTAQASGFPGDQKPTGEPDKELLEKLTGAGPSLEIPDGFIGTGVSFEGLASWYGPGFEGNSTANGDKFDSRLYTAASKELPLGTWLHITHEGRGVVVLVNDRGPYVEPRVLDLSKAAAEAIQMVGKGVGWVRAQIIVKA